MDRAQEIAENIDRVRERMAAAARRAGRSDQSVTLIAVTKTHAANVVELALAAGVADCGENRVQEAEDKIALLPPGVRWHLIGQLQRNKARRAAQHFDLIHSIDNVRLAEALNGYVAERADQVSSARLPVLVQVNVSGEATKGGFEVVGGVQNAAAVDQLVQQLDQMLALPLVDVQGLMTIAPYADTPEAARPVFRSLRLLRDALARRVPQAHLPHLSMGMTNDFEVAIEEGATLVRVGRAIFGERG